MSKPTSHLNKHLEVTVMFEPHRHEHDLLHAAYVFLVPSSRRRLGVLPPSPVATTTLPPHWKERNKP
jgi:hypothetical protein